jgi:GMP synthase (glutamine-hydrolysing)
MKRVLVIDAVEYSAEEAASKLGGPPAWFRQALSGIPDISVECVGASSPDLAAAAGSADAVILSGSPRDAWSDEPESLAYLNMVRGWLESGRAMFGVCHGHQVMGRTAGAEVARSPKGWELGNTAITLTAEGAASPVFAGMRTAGAAAAADFVFLESHQDAVLTIPRNATLLGGNVHTPVQALAYGPLQFSVQFHPEFTPEILRVLWTERRVTLRGTLPFDIDQVLEAAAATPHAPGLFARFLDLIPSA